MASTASQAARETARLGVEGVAAGIIEIGAATPVVAPLCVALLEAKKIVDGASRNKEELEELLLISKIITETVIDEAKASRTSTIDVKSLQECVDELKVVAERYHDRGRLARLVHFRTDGDDIRRLRVRIDAVVPIMGLAGVVNIADKIQEIMTPLELAPRPRGWEPGEAWHAVRHEVEDDVYDILGGDGGPAVAALTGRSGAGKSTAAAAMVGERQGPIRPRAGETEEQARIRLDRFRALFSAGVIWLRVGKGAGAADRLPGLMHKLASALYEDVMKTLVDAPEVGEAGESYVKRIVEQKSLRCLVVADDVWEKEVVEKLRQTGMWVLLTTREAENVGVEPNEAVHVDRLTQVEAEDVLRGAARLPPDERLCDAAADVLEICDYAAMDIAFVGGWESVRTPHGGDHMGREAWAGVLREITAQKSKAENAGAMDDLDPNRLGIFRAGFEYIASENGLAGKLYAMLAVFPNGHAIGHSDAGVLLNRSEGVVRGTMTVLERWTVLGKDASENYRMHDFHMDFARGLLAKRGDLREQAIQRWTTHISRLEVAIGIGLYTLLDLWRVLKLEVGGKGWFDTRPYDDQLVEMDLSDPSKLYAVNFVAELYEHEQKFEAEALMQRVLERCDDLDKEDSRDVQMTALYQIEQSLISQGRFQEYYDLERRLGEMVGPDFQPHLPDCDAGFTQTTFHIYGVCARAAGHLKDAEEWFRKALRVEEDGGRTASSQAASTLHSMGRCLQQDRRPEEAEGLFRRALEVKEARLGVDHVNVALTLYWLAMCVREAGKYGEAESLFRRALEIWEAKLGADHVDVALTLYWLAMCVREAGKYGEAEALLRRALEIREAKLGVDHVNVALTLYWLAMCVREAGKYGEAEALLKRALEIYEAKLGADHVHVAAIRLELSGQAETE